MTEKFQVAVRSLVEFVLTRGDLNMTFTGASRAAEAIRAHQRVQKGRPAGYVAEVPVSHIVETGPFTLEISGRVDGIYMPEAGEGSAPVMIDEIKTTVGDLEAALSHENPVHWGQVKAYAYMYGVANSLSTMNVQLTYYQLDSREQVEAQKTFTIKELETFFKDLVAHYLKWMAVLAEWAIVRDRSIKALKFPFSTYRPGQREMAVQVYKTIQHDRQMIFQAPTGIGKTMAVLFPAVMALGRGMVNKVFYLTARTTARTVAEETIDVLSRNGLSIKALTLTAKEKICFNPEAACDGSACEFARGYFDRVAAAREFLFGRADLFTREEIVSIAKTYRVCPFEFSLDLTLWADVIVCDYNYAFDPRVYLRRFFTDRTDKYTFLVDEAHNLVDRSREMFSAAIRKQPFLNLRRAVRSALPVLFKAMGKINSELVTVRKACEMAGGMIAGSTVPERLVSLLTHWHALAEKYLATNGDASYRDDLLDLYFEVGAFLRISDIYDDGYVTYMKQAGTDVCIKLFCIDPAGKMKEALERCNSVVFFSATLAPAGYIRETFGCGPSAACYSLPSPFPREHLKLMVSNFVSTRYRERDKSLPTLVQLIRTMTASVTGNYMIFFPSYYYMTAAYDRFHATYPNEAVLVQTPGMSEDARDAFLMKFAKNNPRPLIGFAVMGGIFGEGIDLKGNRLTGAMIVGVGLPGISDENELIRKHFDRAKGAGFEYAYLYPGINRVLQAAGRVIRSETDRGVVLLVDERYATVRYRELLPAHWTPDYTRTEKEVADVLQAFWERMLEYYKEGSGTDRKQSPCETVFRLPSAV